MNLCFLNDISLTYTSVDAVIQHIQLFDDPYISKQDIACAFTHIIVHPIDWHLLGFKRQNNYYFSMCLVFSCHSSPYLYNQFVDSLEYMAKYRGNSELLAHHMDESFNMESFEKVTKYSKKLLLWKAGNCSFKSVTCL